MPTNNYTLGRGKVYFSRFVTGTYRPAGYRYIGNTPEFSLNIESEELDHYNSDEGIREKDDSVPLEVNRTGSLVTDNIHPANVAMFFFGENSVLTQAPVGAQTLTVEDIIGGNVYKIGATEDNPTGYFGIDADTFSATVGAGAQASGTATFASTGPANGQTMEIGDTTYTFVTALSTGPTVPNEIVINADPVVVAQRLADAINGMPGTFVSVGTVENGEVFATAAGAVTTVTARDGGTGGNSIVFDVQTAVNTTLDPAGGTLAGGTGTPTPLVLNTDYTLDADNGLIFLDETSVLAVDGADLNYTFSVRGSTRDRVISGSTPVEGAMLYVTRNPKGTDSVFTLPYIKVTPNGDYALKGDEWQQIPMQFEVLKREGVDAILRDGVPVYS